MGGERRRSSAGAHAPTAEPPRSSLGAGCSAAPLPPPKAAATPLQLASSRRWLAGGSLTFIRTCTVGVASQPHRALLIGLSVTLELHFS